MIDHLAQGIYVRMYIRMWYCILTFFVFQMYVYQDTRPCVSSQERRIGTQVCYYIFMTGQVVSASHNSKLLGQFLQTYKTYFIVYIRTYVPNLLRSS